MGRGATKAMDNPWYQARIEAATGNERLYSRMGAAELAGMSEDSIKATELGLEKCMPVEKAVILADLYNAPNMLNYYCLHECPIGRTRPISDETPSIDRITVKLLKELKIQDIESVKDKLMNIAEDGEISEKEIPDLVAVGDYLNDLSKSISELNNLIARVTR